MSGGENLGPVYVSPPWRFGSSTVLVTRLTTVNPNCLGAQAWQVRAAVADAQPQAELTSSSLAFGAGGASAVDATLGRGAADRLDLGDGDSLDTLGAGNLENRALAGDANPRMRLASSSLAFGAGGASAVDATISRSGASAFQCAASFSPDANLTRLFGALGNAWSQVHGGHLVASLSVQFNSGGTQAGSGNVRISDGTGFDVVRRTSAGADRTILSAPQTAGASAFVFGPGNNTDWTAFHLPNYGTAETVMRHGGRDTLSVVAASAAPGDANRYRIAFGGAPVAWQSLEGGTFLRNAGVVPTGNPTDGSFLYVEGGATKIRGSGGTITTIAPAEPHCPTCGRDCALEWHNPADRWELIVCVWCLTEAIGNVGVMRKVQR